MQLQSIMKKRILYLTIIAVTVVTGITVRAKKDWFPDIVNLYLGDILYAFMMYFIVCFISLKFNSRLKFIIALLICYLIEISQLYKSAWINSLRVTTLGKLVLGSGFLWSDLLAYALGVCVAFAIDKFWLSGEVNSRQISV